MKTSIKKVERICYTCEYCGKESYDEYETEWCEKYCKQNNCLHLEFIYDYKIREDGIEVFKRCRNCKKEFNTRRLESGDLEIIMKTKILKEI